MALDFDEDKVGVAPSYPLGSHPARIVRKGEVGVRNPMADDREKGFSDVNLGV